MKRPARFGLALDAGQARLVHEALAGLPYAAVHALIGRLEDWAAGIGSGIGSGAAPFALDEDELVLVLRALGLLPYRRVHALVAGLRAQLQAFRAALGAAA